MLLRIVFGLGTLSGLIAASLLHGSFSQASPPAAQGPVVRVDESKLAVSYVNAYRIHTTGEEVVMDLGFNMPNPNAADAKSGELLFGVSNRIILSYGNAKRLQNSLGSLIKR